MLVVCLDCVSSYRVDPAILAGTDAASSCAHCRRPLQDDADAIAMEAPVPEPEPSAAPGVLAGVGVLALISGVLFWHGAIAGAVPAIEGLYGLIGLAPHAAVPAVSELETRWEQDGLRVTGTLANPGTGKLTVPGIRITVRDGAAETLYSWVVPAPKTSLGSGESLSFTSRLDRLPAQGRDIAIGFTAARMALSEEAAKGVR